MEQVIVERVFDEPVDVAELHATEGAALRCFQANDVRILRSYLSHDCTRMICVFEAPDAEAVRTANRTAGLPFERVWIACVLEADPDVSGTPG